MELHEQLRAKVLVLRAQLGDKDAFGRLFERYHGPVLYYVRRLLGDLDRAEDVLQDVWLTVYRQIGRLEEPLAFPVWLYRIARNKTIQRLRAKRIEIPLEEHSAAWAEVPADDFTPEQAGQIHTCLEKLSRRHREVLVLRFMQQMKYEQIASVVGCSVGTVKSRLHHAKHKLRAEMERQHDHR